MKNIIRISVLTVVVTFLSVMFLSAQEHNHTHKADKNKESNKMLDAKEMDKNNDGKVYQCSMCSDQISDKPGDCPNCGMKLSEVSVDQANKKMMKNGKMMDHKKMKQDKNMKDHKNMMNKEIKMKGMDNVSGMTGGMVHKGIIDVNSIDKNKDGKVYQDMMDWNVISDKAGDCPVCGMKLKEVSIDDAKNNLKKNGFKIK